MNSKLVPIMHFLQIFLLLIGILSFASDATFQKQENAQKHLVVTSDKDSIIRYLALGDSYTAGTSVRKGKSFPHQLADCLEKKLQKMVQFKVIAKAGWRTDELLSSLKVGTVQSSYDVVTLLIGVNNHYQKKGFNQYKKEFPKLLEQAITFAGGEAHKVIVITIPDWGYTPFGEKDGRKNISKDIDKYNAFAEKKAGEYQATFVSITDISREGLKDANLVAKDGLHPSGLAYKRFVERICPSVVTILDKNLKH